MCTRVPSWDVILRGRSGALFSPFVTPVQGTYRTAEELSGLKPLQTLEQEMCSNYVWAETFRDAKRNSNCRLISALSHIG